MYNYDLKMNFISGLNGEANKVLFGSTFNVIAPYEEAKLKDIGEMSLVEWRECIVFSGTYTFSKVDRLVKTIKQYAQWYSDNVNLITNKQIKSLSVDSIDISENVRKTLIPQFKKVLDATCSRPAAKGFPEQIFLCMAWMGLKNSEIPKVLNKEVKINYNTVVIEIGDTFVSTQDTDVIQTFKDYVLYCSNQTLGSTFSAFDFDSTHFVKRAMLKRTNNPKPYSSNEIAVKIIRWTELQESFPGITLDVLTVSGALTRLLAVERAGGEITQEIVQNEMKLRGIKHVNNYIRLYEVFKREFEL